jgi:DNA replication protein DnaC
MTDNISPMPELTPMLKKLKLSGMIENLATHNREAIAKKLTYPEFFALLVQDELLRREQSRFGSRLKKSGFKNNKTLENFDFAFNPKINEKLIRDIASCHFMQEKVSVIFKGSCGTGKSHIAQAIGHCAIRQGADVLFLTQVALLREFHNAKAAGKYEKLLKKLSKVPLLIIDDFGLKPLRTPDDEYFHELIEGRYEVNATLITSNLDVDEWLQVFSNKLLGAATVDRLRHAAYQTELMGKSYRQAQTSKEKKKE